MKILESRAKSFYKLKNVKLLKSYITGQREAEILNKKKNTKKHRDFSQEKKQMERKNDAVRFLASPKSGTIVRLDIWFPLSILVTVALSPTLP